MINRFLPSTRHPSSAHTKNEKEAFCQKCFTSGHWTYQCTEKNSSQYTKRPSYTQRLEMMRKGIPIPNDADDDLEMKSKEVFEDEDAIWTNSESDSYLNPNGSGGDSSSSSSTSSYSSGSDEASKKKKKRKTAKKRKRTSSTTSSSSSSESSSEEEPSKEHKTENEALLEYRKRLKQELEKQLQQHKEEEEAAMKQLSSSNQQAKETNQSEKAHTKNEDSTTATTWQTTQGERRLGSSTSTLPRAQQDTASSSASGAPSTAKRGIEMAAERMAQEQRFSQTRRYGGNNDRKSYDKQSLRDLSVNESREGSSSSTSSQRSAPPPRAYQSNRYGRVKDDTKE
ncbi:hypothetical protein FDP41_012464 [Naegleria fowleri]|uniref:Zinc knuckle domain-containing protein n=1 Tax=Naegleria fowleri TaxID=5763 RepID=A0A6A5BX15_NAEFO|nr:uncharacterized protein FDP41_012464 [Naegleria fowleri]KAF0981807.1 hypothetical protein FDP41_012464 [Naegleria fowleri]